MAKDFNPLTHRHPEYERLAGKWRFTHRVYSGTYLEDEHIDSFLHQREHSEHDDQYKDRKKNIRPTLLLPNLFGRIVGQLEGAASQSEIVWEGSRLGDPETPGTRAHQLTTNIDGAGLDLRGWRQRLRLALLQYETVFVLPERTEDHGPVVWRIVPPTVVEDFFPNEPPFEWVKVRTSYTRRAGFMAEPERIHRVTVYATEGFHQWEWRDKDETEEDAVRITPDGGVPYAFFDADGRTPRLPIFRASLGFDYYIGHLLAVRHAAYLNQDSELRNIFRLANTPILKGWFNNDSTRDKFINARKQGSNFAALQAGGEPDTSREDLAYVRVETDHAQTVQAEMERDRRTFNEDAFQLYEDQARDRTAAEIRQTNSAGREALLALIAQTEDEVLRNALLRTEQIEFPGSRAAWGQARVERKHWSFAPAPTDRERHDESKAQAETAAAWSATGLVSDRRALIEAGKTEDEADEIISDRAGRLTEETTQP